MSLIFPLLYFLLSTGTFVLISKKKFGISLPIVMMLSAFTLFFSQLIFSTFWVGSIVNILFAIAFPALLIRMKIKRESFKQIKDNYLSGGLLAFLIVYLLCVIFDFYRPFTKWDEFSHWGVMIKEMLRLDSFYSVEASTLMIHKDYPPIIQLFELFWSYLSLGFSESSLIQCIHILSLSFFIPLISEQKVNKKNFFKIVIQDVLLFASIYLLILSFDMHTVINSIYVDYLMVIVFAYSCYQIISSNGNNSKFNIVSLSISLSFLLLIKQMSLAFFAMIIFLFVGDNFIRKKYYSNIKQLFSKISFKKVILCCIFLLIIPLAIYKIWGLYVEFLGIVGQFELSDIKIFELRNLLHGTYGFDYQRVTYDNYMAAIKTMELGTGCLKLTYFKWMILSSLLLYSIKYIYKKYFYKLQITLINIMSVIGYVGYAISMLLLYVFIFGSYEGPRLSSFDRYLPTFILGIILLTFEIFIFCNIKHGQKKKKIILWPLFAIFIFLLIIQSPEKHSYMTAALTQSTEKSRYYVYAKKVVNNTPDGSKIFVVAEGLDVSYSYFVKYYSGARKFNLNYLGMDTGLVLTDKLYEDIKKTISSYDYLYIIKINDSFEKKYGNMFADEIKEGAIYKIKKESDNLILNMICD